MGSGQLGSGSKRVVAIKAAEVKKLVSEKDQINSGRPKKAKKPRKFKRSKSAAQTEGETREQLCSFCGTKVSPRKRARHVKTCRFRKVPFAERLSGCSFCNLKFLKQSLARHVKLAHPRPRWSALELPILVVSQPRQTIPRPRAEGLIPCDVCGELILPDSMTQHAQSFHSTEAELRAILSDARRLPFVLLPPDKAILRDAIEHFRGLSRTHANSLTGASFEWSRLQRIQAMGPTNRYIGLKLWKGYVVFEFEQTDLVILECPATGNATYVIRGEWRHLVMETKVNLRSKYSRVATRIIHTNSWEDRVRSTVFIGKKPAPLSRR